MIKQTKHLKLFNSCRPVKGIVRSTIYDLQRGKIKFIPNDLYDILMSYNGSDVNEIYESFEKKEWHILEEYFDFLIKNEFAFWCEDPTLFPEMDLNWETPSIIDNGIVDANNRSNHDFSLIFKNYEEVGCKHLQIRFFDAIEVSFLEQTMSEIKKSSICTIEIFIKYTESISLEQVKYFLGLNTRVINLVIHSSPNNHQPFKDTMDPMNVTYIKQNIDSNNHCGNIGTNNFIVNQSFYLESLKFNNCLNKKISIDTNGLIKNCPSLEKSFGNIKEVTFKEVVSKEDFRKIWKVHKDQIEDCKVCEFKYACFDCRAFLDSDKMYHSKPAKCNYDPYTATWSDKI